VLSIATVSNGVVTAGADPTHHLQTRMSGRRWTSGTFVSPWRLFASAATGGLSNGLLYTSQNRRCANAQRGADVDEDLQGGEPPVPLDQADIIPVQMRRFRKFLLGHPDRFALSAQFVP